MSLTTIVLPTPPLGRALTGEVIPKTDVAILVILNNSASLLDSQGLKLFTGVKRMGMGCAELALGLTLVRETVLISEFVDLFGFL